MAVDEALMLDAVENGVATLRFYQWNEPTLSLGYFQRYADRAQHSASRDCPVVRRQTGGGAILHDRELTYSLAVPASFPLARHAGNLYGAVHNAFIAALSSADPPDSSRQPTLRIRGGEAESPSSNEPFLCFERRSPGDVILVPGCEGESAAPLASNSPDRGWKVLGSAQRRHHGAILQHGSLIVEKSRAAPELPGLRDLYGVDFGIKELIGAATAKLAPALDFRWIPSGLPAGLQSKAAQLANNKYGSPAWTKRR